MKGYYRQGMMKAGAGVAALLCASSLCAQTATVSTRIVSGDPGAIGTTFDVAYEVSANPGGTVPGSADLRVSYPNSSVTFVTVLSGNLGSPIPGAPEQIAPGVLARDIITQGNTSNADDTPICFTVRYQVNAAPAVPYTLTVAADPDGPPLFDTNLVNPIAATFDYTQTTNIGGVIITPTASPTPSPSPTASPTASPSATPTPIPDMARVVSSVVNGDPGNPGETITVLVEVDVNPTGQVPGAASFNMRYDLDSVSYVSSAPGDLGSLFVSGTEVPLGGNVVERTISTSGNPANADDTPQVFTVDFQLNSPSAVFPYTIEFLDDPGTTRPLVETDATTEILHFFDFRGTTTLPTTPTPTPTPSPTPSPSPSPSASPTASPTESPTPSPSASPTESPTPSPSPSASPSPTASPSASPSASPTDSPTPSPTASASPSPSASPTPSPSASQSPSPSPSPSASPSPTASPTPTASPSPEPTPLTYDFPTDTEGWSFVAVPEFFGVPESSHTPGDPGLLNITANSNVSNFGFWKSPLAPVAGDGSVRGTVGLINGTVYQAKWDVRSNSTNALTTPQFRMRANAQNSQQADLVAVESITDAAFSPTVGNNKSFLLHFITPAGSPLYDYNFDLVGLDARDSATDTVSLDKLVVTTVPSSTFDGAQLEQSWTFDATTEGWVTGNAVPILDPPVFSYDLAGGRLALQVVPSDGVVFGFWGSPETGVSRVFPQAGRMYFAIFTIGTDQAVADNVPTFRARINEHGFRVGQLTAIASTGPAANVPTVGNSREYVVIFPPDTGIDTFLHFSVDLLSAPTAEGTPSNASVFVEQVDVYSVPVSAPPTP